MSRGGGSTSCKEAIKRWKEKTGEDPTTAEKVKLLCQIPSIIKMDSHLNTLHACQHLSLSTNAIEKMFQLQLKSLKILSLGRNNIKKIEKLEEVAPTLEQLWISHNQIERLGDGLASLKKLRVLYMSNNNIKNWAELERLKMNESLEELLLIGNPIYEDKTKDQVLAHVLHYLPDLKKLDGEVITDIARRRALHPEEKKE